MTEGEEDPFRTLLCKTILFDAQEESNILSDVYSSEPYVVD